MDTLDSPARERLADRLDSHPLADEPEHMQALSIRVALQPARKNLLMDQAISRVRGLELKPDKLVPMVRWLVLHREPGRILSFLTEADVKKDEKLLTNYLNALTMLGRNKDLARIIDDRSFTMRAATRTFFQAHMARVNGEPGFTISVNPNHEGTVRQPDASQEKGLSSGFRFPLSRFSHAVACVGSWKSKNSPSPSSPARR